MGLSFHHNADGTITGDDWFGGDGFGDARAGGHGPAARRGGHRGDGPGAGAGQQSLNSGDWFRIWERRDVKRP